MYGVYGYNIYIYFICKYVSMFMSMCVYVCIIFIMLTDKKHL